MVPPSSAAVRWTVIAGLAFAGAAALAPSAVPIYDGIGNPDEPYRYVVPPPNYRDTQPPTTATRTLRVTNGRSVSAQINTAEFGPQLALFVPTGAFAAPGTSSHVTVTAAPVAPPEHLPTDGTIVGNVYRISAVAPGGNVDLIGAGDQAPVLDMRAPTARQPGPVFEHLENGEWTSYVTSRVGNDIYRTRAPALGDWARVRRDAAGSDDTSATLPVIAGVLGASGLAIAVLAIRRSRTGRKAAEVNR